MFRCFRPSRAIGLVVIALCLAMRCNAVVSPLEINTVALTATDGVYGPNEGAGIQFASVATGINVNRFGEWGAVFETGTLTPTPAVYRGRGRQRSVIVRRTDVVPGLAGATYGTIASTGINGITDDGRVMFEATPAGSSVSRENSLTYFAGDGTRATVMARRGGFAAADPLSFSFMNNFETAGDRAIALAAGRVSTQSAVWLGEPGDIRAVAIRGQQAVDVEPGVTYDDGMFPVGLSRSGRLLFQTRLLNAAQGTSTSGLFVADSSSARLLARTSDPAPGRPAGVTFDQFQRSVIRDNGEVAFTCTAGLYVSTSGSARLVTTLGANAPGDPASATILSFGDLQSAGASGFLIKGTMQGPGILEHNAQRIWRDRGLGLEEILRTGQQAPSTPVGTTFSELNCEPGSELGQFAVAGILRGADITTANDGWLGVWDPIAGLIPVAREGDLFLVGDGEWKTLRGFNSVRMHDLDPGAAIPGTDRFVPLDGPMTLMSFGAAFTDNTSGVFTVIVPAPGTLVLPGVAMLMLSHRRRRDMNADRRGWRYR